MAFETLSTVQFASLVTAVTMLHDGDTCVVGIRGSNYLRLYSLSQLKASVVPPCCCWTQLHEVLAAESALPYICRPG